MLAVCHVRSRWADEWSLAENLECVQVVDVAGPQHSHASFVWRYGTGTVPDFVSTDQNWRPIAVVPQSDLVDYYVRVTVNPGESDQWFWWGIFTESSNQLEGSFAGTQGATSDGQQHLTAMALTWLLEKMPGVRQTIIGRKPSGSPGEIERIVNEALPIHAKNWRNRDANSYARQAFAHPDPSATSEPFLSGLYFERFYPRRFVTAFLALQYFLYWFSPRDRDGNQSIRFRVAEHPGLNYELPYFEYEGQTLWEIVNLDKKPEVFGIGRALKIPRQQVLGCLFLLWTWFDEQTSDGNMYGVDREDADQVVDCPGFASAAESVGWLDVIADDRNDIIGLQMPAFDEHCSQTAKDRASDARRKGIERKRKKQAAGQMSESNRTESGPDKIREEHKNTGPEKGGPGNSDLTNWVREKLGVKGQTPLESLATCAQAKRCWTKSGGWDDVWISRLASREASEVAEASRNIVTWFRRQLSAPDPVCADPTTAAAAGVLAIAREASRRPGIKNRVAWFRSAITKRNLHLIEDIGQLKIAAKFVSKEFQK